MRTRPKGSDKSGFALLTTLCIFSLLLITVIGAEALRRASRSRSQALLNRELARQEAQFALDEALATLEATAGYDQCATGPATGATAERNWYVARRPGKEPVVLVSKGSEDDEPAGEIQLLGPASAGNEPANWAHAPLLKRSDPRGRAIARRSWWIADQGTKAPLGVRDFRSDEALFPLDAPSDHFLDSWDLLRQSMPGVPQGPKRFSALSDQDPHREHALVDEQLALLAGVDGEAFPLHDFTAFNAFTRANPAEGGLKEDLGSVYAAGAAPAFIREAPPGTIQWLRNLTPPGELLLPKPAQVDAPAVQPVITEFTLICGLAADKDIYGVYLPVILNYHVLADIWNPYPRTLSMSHRAGDILVRVRGLPKITFPQGSAILPDPFEFQLDCYEDMPPGQVQLLSSPESGEGTSGTGVWQVEVGTATMTSDWMLVPLQLSQADVTVEFIDAGAPESPPFMTVELTGYPSYLIDYKRDEEMRFSRTRSEMSRSALSQPGWVFAYHFRMRDSFSSDEPQLLQWTSARDPRDLKHTIDTRAEDTGPWHILQRPLDFRRGDVARPSDFFDSRYSTNGPKIDRRAILFDTPAQPLHSIGQLRHMAIPAAPPFAIGSASGGAHNRIFDRFYFSTPGEPKPPESLQRGGFNINSTSRAAWSAVLKSMRNPAFPLSGVPSADTLDFNAPFLNLPHGGNHMVNQAAAAAIAAQDPSAFDGLSPALAEERHHNAFLVGVRDLDDDTIDALAAEIVRRLEARPHPFESMEAFANSNLLQDAIDAVPAINLRQGTLDAIPRNSPAHLSQGTLLSALAPVLFSRSDTFLIRTHGEVLDAAGKPRSQAFLEALVQRQGHTISDDVEDKRPFKILYIRWLSPTDL